jgi:4-hydroxy-3-methylbut-2-en-1-yl diphosphate reductase
MKVILANPRGFCAGVDRAIDIVNRALDLFGAPIYVRHEVVHNRPVVDALKLRGAIFTDFIEEIPRGATAIFSAHGVSKAVRKQAAERDLKIFDATCPLVTKVHMEVARLSRAGVECVLIGHAGHPEVEGTMGQYQNPEFGIYLVETVADVDDLTINNPERCAYVSQTTLSVDDTKAIIAALKQRFPLIQGPKKDDICYATQNRQDAVKALADQSDVIVVVGSETSSNSNRLRELAERKGVPAYLVDNPCLLQQAWFEGKKVIGVTAGASAPESLVQQVVYRLVEWGAQPPDELPGVEETITFVLPKELRETAG